MKSDFESRLAALAGEENLDAAKQLLKSRAPLTGAWRDGRGRLHGIFAENGRRAEVTVMTGDEPQSDCSCGDTGFCRHAAALVMYSGRFRVQPPPPEEEPFYLSGLRKEELPQLIKAAQHPVASLTIQAQSAFPHVPSKWENLTMRITLKGRGREYLGNLNNLRKLYFDKSLGAVLQWEDFPLQERQIIRFLSLYSEADGSNLLLDAEYTAEFFHSLGGFEGFFRNGQRLVIRTERAEAVLIRHRNRYLPGLRFGGAVIPAVDTKVITGRSGCWVGRGGEYFFVPAAGDVGYMRSFFRSKGWTPDISVDDIAMLSGFQLPVIRMDRPEPETGSCRGVQLESEIDREAGELTLEIRYLYDTGSGCDAAFAPRSGTLVFAGRKVFQRDSVFERHFESALELFGFSVGHGKAVLTGFASIGLWLDRGLAGLSESFRLLLAPGLARLSAGMTGLPELALRCRYLDTNAAGYILEYTLSAAGELAEWQSAVDTAAAGNIYLPLSGGMAEIPPPAGRFLRASKRIVRDVDDVGRRFTVPFCNAAYFVKMLQDLPGAVPPELAASVTAVSQTPAPVFERAFKFQGELRKYQEEGVAFMQFMTDRGFNCLLADEMGLGKTVQMLALLASRRRRGDAPVLLVCPASLTANWQREANRFVPDMKVAVPAGNERSRVLASAAEYDMIILSYAAARLSRDHLKKISFSFLILDEAQHIKNPSSGNAKNCKVLKAEHRIVLTGTPLENSPEDLWSVMDFLQPGMLGTLAEFRRTYAGLADDPELQQDLAARVSPFIKRRTKSEVAADLPPRTELTLYCTLPPEQRKLYEEVLQQGRRELSACEADGGRDVSRIFTTLLRLRQICCHPALLPDGAGENIPSAKTELLNELLDENIDSSHRLLLFSQFTSLLHLLEDELKNRSIPYEYLDGSTRNRQERVDNFNQNPEIPLFLLSLKAGGTGLNLTGADTVVIYDPWWNPAVELQAADRTHRIGQTRPVTVIRLVVKDSVEERILDLQERKRQVFDALVAEPGAGGGLSLEDLRELLA